MRLLNGTCHKYEDEADRIIAEWARTETSRAKKALILTAWKYEDRLDHEVFTSTGFADPAVRRGMFHRTWNRRHAHLNSRDGHYPSRRIQSALEDMTDAGDYDIAEC